MTTTRFVKVECDRCGIVYTYQWNAWDLRLSEVRDYLSQKGWTTIRKFDYCDNCSNDR